MSADQDRTDPSPANTRGAENAQSIDRAEEYDRAVSDREIRRPTNAGFADADPVMNARNNVGANAGTEAGDRAALFEPVLLQAFNNRWTEVQTSFVDEPRRAVQQADGLVSDVIQKIADTFGRERAQLEQQWDRGDDVSTEELRQALQRYRSFFSRLLTL